MQYDVSLRGGRGQRSNPAVSILTATFVAWLMLNLDHPALPWPLALLRQLPTTRPTHRLPWTASQTKKPSLFSAWVLHQMWHSTLTSPWFNQAQDAAGKPGFTLALWLDPASRTPERRQFLSRTPQHPMAKLRTVYKPGDDFERQQLLLFLIFTYILKHELLESWHLTTISRCCVQAVNEWAMQRQVVQFLLRSKGAGRPQQPATVFRAFTCCKLTPFNISWSHQVTCMQQSAGISLKGWFV